RPPRSSNGPTADAEWSPGSAVPVTSTARPVARDAVSRPAGERDPAAEPPQVTWEVREVRQEPLEMRGGDLRPDATPPLNGRRSTPHRTPPRPDRSAPEAARAATSKAHGTRARDTGAGEALAPETERALRGERAAPGRVHETGARKTERTLREERAALSHDR